MVHICRDHRLFVFYCFVNCEERKSLMTKTIKTGVKKFIRNLPDIIYGICFMGAFLCMCWYLFGVCDLAYVNF